jgi:uncharacterized protein (DUF433 family)
LHGVLTGLQCDRQGGVLATGGEKRLAAARPGVQIAAMKNGKKRAPARVELGRYIVADPDICHGKPTFKGTRIMVWQVLDELAHGMSPDKIYAVWGGRVSREAIAESVSLARLSLLDGHGRLRHPEELRATA